MGNGFMHDLALMHVDTVCKMRIFPDRQIIAFIGKHLDERQGDVIQRKRRGTRHGARHIRHTIMNHVIDYIGRIGMRCRPAGFKTSTLVNRDVHQCRPISTEPITRSAVVTNVSTLSSVE